eukprot:scaffold42383_cov62-Attheya_sp.AAC.11
MGLVMEKRVIFSVCVYKLATANPVLHAHNGWWYSNPSRGTKAARLLSGEQQDELTSFLYILYYWAGTCCVLLVHYDLQSSKLLISKLI